MEKNRPSYNKFKEGWSGYINISKIHFRAKNIIRDQEGNYTMIKESVHQRDIPTIIF